MIGIAIATAISVSTETVREWPTNPGEHIKDLSRYSARGPVKLEQILGFDAKRSATRTSTQRR